MSTFKPLYGAAGTLTLTIASLANNTVNSSAVIDNTSDLNADMAVHVRVRAPASGTLTNGYAEIAVHPSMDDGTTFAGTTATGAATSVTKRSAGFKIAGRIPFISNGQDNDLSFNIASLFGGVMPKKCLITIENKTGGTLDTTAGNHFVKLQGVQYQAV